VRSHCFPSRTFTSRRNACSKRLRLVRPARGLSFHSASFQLQRKHQNLKTLEAPRTNTKSSTGCCCVPVASASKWPRRCSCFRARSLRSRPKRESCESIFHCPMHQLSTCAGAFIGKVFPSRCMLHLLPSRPAGVNTSAYAGGTAIRPHCCGRLKSQRSQQHTHKSTLRPPSTRPQHTHVLRVRQCPRFPLSSTKSCTRCAWQEGRDARAF
jgi:hypothetical protein